MFSACLFGCVAAAPLVPETIVAEDPAEDCPVEDDDYDPRKPQYIVFASEEDIEKESEDLLTRQMAKLEAIAARRQGREEKAVVQHYRSVLDEMKSQAKAGRRQEPPRAQSFELPVVHEEPVDFEPRARNRSEPIDFEPQEWQCNAGNTEETEPRSQELPSEENSTLQPEGLPVPEDMPLLPSMPLKCLNIAPGHAQSIIAALTCKPNGYAAPLKAGLMDAVAAAVQYNLGWQPLDCSVQDSWYNAGI